MRDIDNRRKSSREKSSTKAGLILLGGNFSDLKQLPVLMKIIDNDDNYSGTTTLPLASTTTTMITITITTCIYLVTIKIMAKIFISRSSKKTASFTFINNVNCNMQMSFLKC